MGFDSYHPVLEFLFFLVVCLCTCCWSHPLCIGIALLSSLVYAVKLQGKRGAIIGVVLLPLVAVWVAFYAYNVHFGVTNLGQTVIGNSITLESTLFGLSIGLRGAAVVLWLSSFLTIFTTDKVVYLAGRISGRFALFVAIVFRALPVVGTQARIIGTAQRGIGRGAGQGSVIRRCSNAVREFSMLLTWCIEHFACTADSMESRGSSLRGRSAFALYRFDGRDRILACAMAISLMVMALGMLTGWTAMLYDPRLVVEPLQAVALAFYAVYAFFCLLPFGLELFGESRLAIALEKLDDGEPVWEGNE